MTAKIFSEGKICRVPHYDAYVITKSHKNLMLVDGLKGTLVVDINSMRHVKYLGSSQRLKAGLVTDNAIFVGCRGKFSSYSLPDYKLKGELDLDCWVR